MKLYPAIDLLDGQAVRLYKGDFAQKTVYAHQPELLGQEFEQKGAEYLHIVDLNGTKAGRVAQTDLIGSIIQNCNLKVQVGGGIRTKENIEQLLELGVERCVLGSICIKEPSLVQDWIEDFGQNRLTLAADIQWQDRRAMVAVHGWQDQSDWDLERFVQTFDLEQRPGLELLCTDVSRDGALSGPNVSLYTDMLERYPNLSIQASGGLASLEDIKQLKQHGLRACITGKALYEQRFTLEEALAC